MSSKTAVATCRRVSQDCRSSSSVCKGTKNDSATALSSASDGTPRAQDPSPAHPGAKDVQGVLGTVVRMTDHPSGRRTRPNRHAQRVADQFGPQVITPGPADDPPAEHIEN